MAQQKKGLGRKLARAGTWQVAKRVARSVPFGGAAVVVFLVGTDIKNKGVTRGLLNSGIDAIPFVGLAKNVAEFVRGEDFIANKRKKEKKL